MVESSLVSVVIPAFNAAGTLSPALQSVFDQEYPALEVIVVNDLSTDGTRRLLDSYENPRLTAIHLERNLGAAGARNKGIEAARGTYVAFLDADDIWLPSKLALQVSQLEVNPQAALATCDTAFYDAGGNLVRTGHSRRPATAGTGAWAALLMENFIPTPTVVTRLDLLRKTGGFDTSLPVGEDLDLWIRLSLLGDVVVVHQVLVHVHEQPVSLMKSHATREAAIVMPMIERHLRAQRERLTQHQAETILGHRAFELGARLMANGAYFDSVPLFWKSALLGYRTGKSLVNVPRALLGACLGLGGARP